MRQPGGGLTKVYGMPALMMYACSCCLTAYTAGQPWGSESLSTENSEGRNLVLGLCWAMASTRICCLARSLGPARLLLSVHVLLVDAGLCLHAKMAWGGLIHVCMAANIML